MAAKDTHCSHCGSRFASVAGYPRTCAGCGATTYANPIPVAVTLVPVGDGVLCVRRGIEPGYGLLALPGGYMTLGETWQEAGAREVREETGVALDPARLGLLTLPGFQPLVTASNGNLVVFLAAPPMAEDALPPFAPDHETLEVVVVRAPIELAFPAHTAALRAHFAARGAGPDASLGGA